MVLTDEVEPATISCSRVCEQDIQNFEEKSGSVLQGAATSIRIQFDCFARRIIIVCKKTIARSVRTVQYC